MVNIADDVRNYPFGNTRTHGMALTIPDAIHLEIGEPHFPTPSFILEGLKILFQRRY